MAEMQILHLLVILVVFALVVSVPIAWVRIFKRVGWPGWLGVLILVPLVNVVLMLVFSFSREWPIERRLKVAEGGSTRPA